MKNQFFFFWKPLFFLFFLFLFSCNTNDSKKSVDDKVNPLLVECWTHSHEEDQSDDTKVFRPCDYLEYPKSRFRAVYDLKSNKDCVFLILSPNDAHYFEAGTWECSEKTNLLVIKNELGEHVQEFKVEKIEENKLVLR